MAGYFVTIWCFGLVELTLRANHLIFQGYTKMGHESKKECDKIIYTLFNMI